MCTCTWLSQRPKDARRCSLSRGFCASRTDLQGSTVLCFPLQMVSARWTANLSQEVSAGWGPRPSLRCRRPSRWRLAPKSSESSCGSSRSAIFAASALLWSQELESCGIPPVFEGSWCGSWRPAWWKSSASSVARPGVPWHTGPWKRCFQHPNLQNLRLAVPEPDEV